jgi:DNA gyrase subunit B
MSHQYDASNIKILGGIEAVRRRPAMYVGSTDEYGLHHLVEEVVDNSIDEALAGCCDYVEVTIHKDNSVTVFDNGRGIPVDLHKEAKKPALEVVMTTLHAGGKFGGGGYKVSGGLHGVGVSVVNALSEWAEVEVYRDGKIYFQKYKRGTTASKLEQKGKTNLKGTKVTFLADKEIFDKVEYKNEVISHRLRELAYLNQGLKIVFNDERIQKKETFKFDGGIRAYVEHLNEKKTPLFKPPVFFSAEKDNIQMEIALQYSGDYYDEQILSFANNIRTREGGSHVSGFRSALTRTINNFGKKYEFIKSEEITGFDVREGLTAVINLRLPDPQFEGQTKTKLGNSEVKGLVESLVNERLLDSLERDPRTGRAIIEKCLEAFRVREAARKAQELARRKNALEASTLPGKLADCTESDPAKCEIFLVEGDSAGGSAKQGRDRNYQAILPLKGKILNVEKARPDKILGNEEIRALITALGPGAVGSIYGELAAANGDNGGEKTDLNDSENQALLKKLRYHKIIIMTDADVDGAHIRTLLLTFFYRFARLIIEEGHLFIAQPPLFLAKNSKEKVYVYHENELKKVVDQLKKSGREKINLQRYKGLGEMNPEQLWETTMNPANRVLLKVDIEDAVEADEIFTILMGTEVEPRRDFIYEYAKKVRWLDV